MTKRSRQGSETRLRIIGAAADLFHKQGVHATSPDDVIEASNTGKGQFYHYFKSKEGLVHEVLQTHLEAIRNGSAPLKYHIESWQDLERWFRTQLELQKRFRMTRGCPFGTIGNEVTENDELIRQDLCLIFEVAPTLGNLPISALQRCRAQCLWARSSAAADRLKQLLRTPLSICVARPGQLVRKRDAPFLSYHTAVRLC